MSDSLRGGSTVGGYLIHHNGLSEAYLGGNKIVTIQTGSGTIPTSGWDTVTGDYTKRYSYAITGVLSTDIVDIYLDKDSQDTALDAEICPTSESYNGGVYIYAKTVPTTSISFSYTILR